MGRRRFATLILGFALALAFPTLSRAQATNTPSNTPTPTVTQTPSGTPTDTWTPIFTYTPNPTLTPPCGAAAGVFGVTTGIYSAPASNTVRASMVTLNSPATVYSLWLLSGSDGISVVAGIYNGGPSSITSLIVQSAPQPALNGWNGFPITPTVLSNGTYWLAYTYNTTSYYVYSPSTSDTTAGTLAFTSAGVTFSTMPGTFPAPSYDARPANTQTPTNYSQDSIYAVYCAAPTYTLTPSNTPTSSNTPTLTPTPTFTLTPTSTGTIFTNTPSPSNTLTPTWTPTVTNTFTPTLTPNEGLTPPCGSSMGTFGNANSTGATYSASYNPSILASLYTLSTSANVFSMAVSTAAVESGAQVAVGIYQGGVSAIGKLIVQSPAQAVTNGWNYFSIPTTFLSSGTYWLAFLYSAPATYTLAASGLAGSPGTEAYTTQTFSIGGGLPTNWSGNAGYGDLNLAIYANYCPSSQDTSTPTDSPTLTPTPTITLTPVPTPTATSPCGAAATFFGSTNTSGGAITLQSEELLAYANSLPVSGTVYGISLYATAYDANDLAEVALYSSQGTTMGTLIADANPQTLTAGWNNFSLPASPVTAGNYWLTYLFQAPVSYSIVYQTPTPGVTPPTLAYDLAVTTNVFPASAASWGTYLAYTNTVLGPIVANYCPGSLNTATPTNTPTLTATFTVSNTPTLTGTPTLSPTSTPTGTPTLTQTASPTATLTNTPTITFTPTDSPTGTPTGTPTLTGTNTPTATITDTPTVTPTFTVSMTPTDSPTATPSGTPTMTATSTSTLTITNTPTITPTFTASNTATASPSSTPTGTSTPTSTASSTPTASATSSPTATGTQPATSTPTSTSSATPSFTPTKTATFSPTASITSTTTFTPTPSPSFTPSGTPTLSPTATWTPTPGADIVKTASESVANVNDTLTYTLTLNVTAGSVTNIAVTDVLPGSLNFVGFGSPTGGVTWTTSWNPSSMTLAWSLAALNPGTYTITFQAQVTGGAQGGAVIANQAQLTYAGLAAPKTSSANVAVAQAAPVLYPNPVRGPGPAELQVVLNQPQDYLKVKVFTTSFRKIYDDTVKTVPAGVFLYGLDSSHFEGGEGANGLYYVMISTPAHHWILKLLVLK